MTTSLNLTTGLVAVAAVVTAGVLAKRKQLPFPPGPKGLPLLGNLYDLPTSFEWLKYQQLGRDLGSDIVYLNVFGTSIIIINSLQAAHDLFERKSSVYSDRPYMTMLHELVGFGTHFTFMEYGDRWRERRKLFHRYFQASAVSGYQSQTTKGARAFLRRLLDSPSDFMEHVRLMAGEVIMDITYGLQIKGLDDPYIMIAEEALDIGTSAASMGTAVNAIPILKYVPAWLPGAGFQRQALEWKKTVADAAVLPFQAVKAATSKGTVKPSVTESMLSGLTDHENNDKKEDMFSTVAAAAYIGGSHTTVSLLQSFILAMVLYPDVQRKAQEHLDRVVGKDRLPELSDQEALPFITAIIKETLRWHPVTPLGLPHKLSSEDEYRGYRMPAGSIVIGNVWAMLRDENVYPEPDVFNPERFLKADGQLNPEVTDPELAAFGFGRRGCPGKHLALSSVWITIASVLSTLRISKAVDSNGNVVEPSGDYTSGVVSSPCPFDCSIKPRFASAESLIRSDLLE